MVVAEVQISPVKDLDEEWFCKMVKEHMDSLIQGLESEGLEVNIYYK